LGALSLGSTPDRKTAKQRAGAGDPDLMNTQLRPANASTFSPRLGFGLMALLLGALLLLRLSAYGIWDPWELGVADAARKHAEGAAPGRPMSLTIHMVSASFAAFGPREWAGRLPLALSGLGALAITFAIGRLFAGVRTGVYAALALASTPFFLLHSREMMGAAPSFLGSSLVMLGAAGLVFAEGATAKARVGYALALALGIGLGTLSAGVLCTVLPPLLAVGLVALYTGRPSRASGSARTLTFAVLALALLVLLLVARALLTHAAGYSIWAGGTPSEASIVTYERAIEHLFHGFAPWSAVLPVALAAVLRPPASEVEAREQNQDERSGALTLGLLCVAWAALAYAAQSIFLSSYGAMAFLAPSALALSVALWLRAREERADSDFAELTVVLLFVGLIIRDFALYPGSPFTALELGETKIPDIFNPKLYWAALLGLFALALALTSFSWGTRGKLDFVAPYRGLKKLWSEGSSGHRAWLVFFALVVLALLFYGALAYAMPRTLRIGSLGRRIGRVLLFLPVLIPIGIAAGQATYHVARRLSGVRSALVLAAAVLIGGYTSQVFLPQLSAHLSPRVVFDTFNKLAKAGEPLAQHRVEGRAAAYYANGEVRDIATQSDLVSFMVAGGRKWAAFPSELLPDIDLAFRRKSGRHLFIPTLDNAKVMLAASQPVPGKADQNPLTRFVKREVPAIQFPVKANFEGKVELLGYNLELPHEGKSVGPGQTFHVTWIWRAKQSDLGAYQVFLHVDSNDQRINGDHDPVDGKYPVRLWDEGDIIIDRQAISIPATSPAGVYSMFVGLFRGESRLKVTEGPRDNEDRANAGTVRVQ
jgi:4-amino-4-deoxy-L-arabinose transferase-like glycosyltransferase